MGPRSSWYFTRGDLQCGVGPPLIILPESHMSASVARLTVLLGTWFAVGGVSCIS